MATKNPFAGYKEGKESKKAEKAESPALKRFEAKRGMDKVDGAKARTMGKTGKR